MLLIAGPAEGSRLCVIGGLAAARGLKGGPLALLPQGAAHGTGAPRPCSRVPQCVTRRQMAAGDFSKIHVIAWFAGLVSGRAAVL